MSSYRVLAVLAGIAGGTLLGLASPIPRLMPAGQVVTVGRPCACGALSGPQGGRPFPALRRQSV